VAERPSGARLPGDDAELSVLLCDDAFIQELNRQYRGLDRPTDVLSFAQEPVPGGPDVLGDIVISVETARRQAREQRHSLAREVEWLLCHGMLHLLGYDDETEEGLEQMRRYQHETLVSAQA
jgi:probable rRNA maturation factor